ncbi:MAG: cyclase [Candidatus Xenobia bacterium]|jgi:kynurenine formamidase
MHELWELARSLRSRRLVDLTQTFRPGIPHYPGYLDETRQDALQLDRFGFWAVYHTLVGAWGTHVDAPAHMFRGGRKVEDLRPEEMILPLVVLDIRSRVEQNPDTVVEMADVQAWEARHGTIPEGAFVALCTGWSRRWPDPEAIANQGRTPGWSLEVLRYLYEVCKITASGHETGDPDPGSSTGRPIPPDRPLPEVLHEWFACEAYILSQDRYQIEFLANLDLVPEVGAMALVTFPKAGDAPNFPARVLAVCP